jgi:hypothetical protein
MLNILFSLSNSQIESPVGYELGDLDLCGELGKATSAQRIPSQSMMLVLSIVELLDGVRRFLSGSNAKQYRFVGVDSSFSVLFVKDKATVNIYVDDSLIHKSTPFALKADVERSVLEFVNKHSVSRITNPAEANDFNNSLQAFRAFAVD